MGGSGSGCWYRWDSKETTESNKRIDIRWLKKHGYLCPGTIGTLSWSYRGEQSGYINYRMEEDRMLLTYRYRLNGGEREPVNQTISFDLTPCYYGGYRKWFLCPRCWKRIAVLYGAGKFFLCRYCHGLSYESQQEDPASRLLSKAQKIRIRLGGSPATGDLFPEKPKGMHWKTYWRLRNEAEQAELLGWVKAGQRFGKVF